MSNDLIVSGVCLCIGLAFLAIAALLRIREEAKARVSRMPNTRKEWHEQW